MVRFISWNVHGGKDSRGNVTTQELASAVLDLQPDAIAMQEVPSYAWARDLANALNLSLYFHQTNASTGQGNAVLSRTPSQSTETRYLSLPCHRAGHEPRGALAVIFQDHTLVNTHLGADPTMSEQYMEAVELEAFARTLPGKVFVAGDFNAHAVSPALNHMRKCGWRDMWKAAEDRKHGYREGCTFHAAFPFQRIDYILCNSPDVRALRAEVCKQPVSDHFGVLVDVEGWQ
jgi:endonuclease/exonuclease/phosphatase family metal-dependent hydrolase